MNRWEVIAGAHRVAAFRKLGLVEIQAIAADADDLHAELAMIDENLMRAELSASERAQQTARRKAIYLELNPLTANGSNQHTRDGQVVQPNFAEATAAVTGSDARTVRRDAERGEKVIDAAHQIIRGTALDTGTYLDKLKRLSPSEQVVAAKRDLAWQKQQQRDAAKNGIQRRIKVADVPISDEEAREHQVAALMSAWNRFSAGLTETAIGPAAGAMADLGELLLKARDAGLSSEEEVKLADLMTFGQQNFPGINLFYVRPALDFLLLNSLREVASPGHGARMERRRRKEYGQKSFVPRRAFDF